MADLDTNDEDVATMERLFPKTPKSLVTVHDSVSDANPATAARVINLSKKTGHAPETVSANLPKFELADSAPKDQDLETIERLYPKTSERVRDPKVMAVAKHDLGSLTAGERLTNAFHGAVDSLKTDLEIGNLEVQKARLWGGDLMGEDNTAAIEDIHKRISEAGAVFGKEQKEPGYLQQSISGAVRLGEPMLESAATGAAFAIGTAAVFPPAVPVAFAVGEAAYWFNFMSAGANEQLAALKDKDGKPLDPALRRTAAFAIGALSSAPAAAGFGAAMRANPALKQIYPTLKKAVGESVLESPGWKDALLGYVKKQAVRGVHFGATMSVLTGIQKEGEAAAKKLSGQPFDFDTAGETLKLMGESFGSGFGVGAVMAAPGAAWELAKDARRLQHQERVAEATKAYVEAVSKVSEGSDYRNLDPEGYAAHVDGMKGPALVPKEAFDAHFQGKGIDPKQAAEELGVSASYALADMHGDNVAIPFGTFQSKIMDAHRVGLVNDIKFNPEDATKNQLKALKQDQVDKAKASQEQVISEAKALKTSPEEQPGFESVREDIKTKLLADPALLLREYTKATGKKVMSDAEAKGWVEDQADLHAKLWMGEARAQGRPVEEVYGGGPQVRAGTEGAAGGMQQGAMDKFMSAIGLKSTPEGTPEGAAPYDQKIAEATYTKFLKVLDEKVPGDTLNREQLEALTKEVTEDERKWSGLDKFMDAQSTLTQAEVDAIKAGSPSWLGVGDWIRTQKPINKAELIDFLKMNKFQVEVRTIGEKVKPTAEGAAEAAKAESELPKVEDLDQSELRDLVEGQYEDEIREVADEAQREAIDDYISNNESEWKVEVEEVPREATDIDDINEESEGKWRVDFDNGHSEEYEAATEEEARALADKDLLHGKVPDGQPEYKLVMNGSDYKDNRRTNPIETYHEDERLANDAAERASDRELESYTESLYNNWQVDEYSEALDSFVEEVEDGHRELEGYAFEGKKEKKNEFTWRASEWKSGGGQSMSGAEPGSERDLVFHAPQLEEYPTDKAHMGDVSKGKDLGWARTALHKLKGAGGKLARLINEMQNNRTQRGMVEGYKSELDQKAYDKWQGEADSLREKVTKARQEKYDVTEDLKDEFRQTKGKYEPITELPEGYKVIEREPGTNPFVVTGPNGHFLHVGETAELVKKEWLENFNKVQEGARAHGSEMQTAQVAFIKEHPKYLAKEQALIAAENAVTDIEAKEPKRGDVPDTPFKKAVYEFQFRRTLRWHVEQDYQAWEASGSKEPFLDWWDKNGIKTLAWITGFQSAERNSRVHDVDTLIYDPVKQELTALKNGEKKIDKMAVTPEGITERLAPSPEGREIVKRLLATEPQKKTEDFSLKADDLRHKIRGSETGADEEKYQKELADLETSSAYEGMHVIHDEGGLKVASKSAKFHYELYDTKVPSFAKKFGGQWKATIGDVEIKTGEQAGNTKYEGPEPGLLELERAGRAIASEGSPNMQAAFRTVLERMKQGMGFSEAMTMGGQESGEAMESVAERFGGAFVEGKAEKYEKVHALHITKEMARAAMYEGVSMFQGDGKDPRAQYLPAERIIELFKRKDPTSFTHETSHDWLEQMFKHVKSGQAIESYLADWRNVSDFLGVKEDQTRLTEAQHEKFADAWEQYLSEGKAPSAELKGIFQRFAEWMTEIYGQAKEALGGQLNDNMRQFFDRRLATQEEIAEARREIGQEPEPPPEGIDPAIEAKRNELEAEARRQAEEVLMKPMLEELKAENKAIAEKERERLTQQLENEAVQEPIFKALSLLNLGRKKTDYWFHANDYLNNKLTEGETENFEAVAEMSGFSSGDELAKAVLLTDPKEALKAEVKKRVDVEMDKFTGMKNKEAMREEALKAVHSDKFTELLALEAQIAQDMIGKVQEKAQEADVLKDVKAETMAAAKTQAAAFKATNSKQLEAQAKMAKEAAKDQARATLANLPIKEAIAFRHFFTAERNAQVRAARATKAGDAEAYAKAKRDQMNAHALASEAIRLKDRVARWTKNLHDAQVADRATFKLEEHFYQAADILRRFGFDRKDYIGNKRKESLTGWVNRMQEKTDIVDIADWIQNESIRKDFADLTPAELKDVRNAVANIKHVANFEDRAYTVFDKADLNDVAGILVKGQMAEAHNEKGAPLSMSQDWRDRLIAQKDTAMFQLIATETWLRKLDGYKNFGPWYRAFYEQFARGSDEKAKMLVEAAESFSKIWDAYTKKERKDMSKKIFIPELGDSLMKSEIMTMALNMGSESNATRLLEGRGWQHEQIMSILNREMTKRDWDTVQKTWDHIDSYWPKIAELYKELTGFTPDKIERRKIMTPFGEYEGGYFPLRADPRVEVKAAQQVDVEASLSDSPPAWRASTKNGFSKGRVEGAQYKVSLDINGIQRHITDVIHDLTLRKWVLDANRLLARKDIQASVADAVGIDGHKMLTNWVKAVAGTNDFQSREYLGDLAHELRRRTIIANLGLRVSSLILQADDLSAYGRVDPDNFGVKNAAQAVVGFYGRVATDPAAYRAGVDFVLSKSKYMKYERGENMDRDIKEAAKREWGKDDKMAKVSMSMISTVDHLLSIPVWTEAYKKGLELNEGNEQKAVDYADYIIRRAQSSGRLGELPEVMRGSEKQKLLTMFYSFVNRRLNLWYEALDKTKFTEPKDLERLAGTVMALWIAPTLLGSFVHNGVPNTPEKKKKYFKDMLLYPTSLFPVIRDVADYAMDKAMGLPSFGYRSTPVTGAFEAIGNMIGTVAKGDKAKTQQKIEKTAKAASYALPYPDVLNSWIFNIADIMNGTMKPKASDVLRRRPAKERHR